MILCTSLISICFVCRCSKCLMPLPGSSSVKQNKHAYPETLTQIAPDGKSSAMRTHKQCSTNLHLEFNLSPNCVVSLTSIGWSCHPYSMQWRRNVLGKVWNIWHNCWMWLRLHQTWYLKWENINKTKFFSLVKGLKYFATSATNHIGCCSWYYFKDLNCLVYLPQTTVPLNTSTASVLQFALGEYLHTHCKQLSEII